MNIVYILTRSDTVGGVQNHVVELAAAMIKDGHTATIICGGTGQYFDKIKAYGVPYKAIETLSNAISISDDWRAYRDVVEVLKQLQPDIVSTHSTKSGLIGRIASKKLGFPVLFTAHGWAFTDGVGRVKQFCYGALERWLSKRTSHILCVSEYDKQLALGVGISEAVLTTVHNGRHDKYDNALTSVDNEVPVIIMIGRLDKQKDHVTLFHALAKLQSTHEFKVVLLGDGPNLARHTELVKKLLLTDRVEFKGLVKQVHHELRQADIFTLITNYEGFPRSTLEAMCAGLPVVVSNAGGSAEAVENDVSGYVIDRHDTDALVTALAKLLGDGNLRKTMGAKGQTMFKQRFTFELMYTKTYTIYERALTQVQSS